MTIKIKCKASNEIFEVSEEEIALRKAIDVPLPTLSPDERARRILARRNERILYKRKCSGTGETTISIHNENAKFPVYSQEYWWSDSWSPYDYGRDYDFSRGFFEQFAELYAQVPQLALNAPNCENSKWNNQSSDLKNCYMVFCSGLSEDCMYGMWNSKSQNCLDCTSAFECRWCYQLVNSNNCFECRNLDNSEQCSNCIFGRDLISCSNCIGCVGLIHKEYHYFNKPVTKEQYEKILKSLKLETRSGVEALEKKFNEFQVKFPRKFYNGMLAENSSGDYLIRTENVHNSYNYRESKNLWNCRDGWNCHNSLSLLECWTQDHCIEIEGSLGATSSGFCNKLWGCGNTWYSSHIYYSKDIFGCVGLRNAEYVILNKKYSKNDFDRLRAKIISQMKESGEWGENFPIKDSPFAYNLSMGQEYFPLSKAEILSRGYQWKDPEEDQSNTNTWEVPDSINEVSTDALKQIIKCKETGMLFKLQKAELDFYKNQNIPVPVFHDRTRFFQRMNNRRNPRKLNSGKCYSCGTEFLTTFPENSALIACEKCYSAHRDQIIIDQ